MFGTYPLPFITVHKDGTWSDPMLLEEMTPRQRGLYVRLIREDAGFGGPKLVMRQARDFVDQLEGKPDPCGDALAEALGVSHLVKKK